MTPKGDAMDHSKALISEIESSLESEMRKRREKIERELEERLSREREESERKLAQIEEEFHKEQGALKEYKSAVIEYEAARETLENQLRERLETVDRHQSEIERLTSLTREELDHIHDLSARLADLRNLTETRVAQFESRLQEKRGAASRPAEEVPPPASAEPVPAAEPAPVREAAVCAPEPSPEKGEVVVDLERELGKLKRIKEMLEKDAAGFPGPAAGTAVPTNTVADPLAPLPEPIAPPEPETPGWSEPPQSENAAARPEFKMPEINQFIQDFVKREHGQTDDTPTVKAEEKRPGLDETDFQSVFEILEKYRRSEPTDYNGEISFFQNRDHLILDGESLLRAVGHIVEEARKLYQRLSQAGTPKDQFFIKQELINNQEILRKIVLRSVRMCEREGSRLPRYTGDIVNSAVLKDILERLNMDNWSNQEDFAAFEILSNKMKDDFYRRITPPAQYLRSIVQELEG
jgi:hypothetical protein